jgi:hypothetical protein
LDRGRDIRGQAVGLHHDSMRRAGFRGDRVLWFPSFM